MLGYRISPQQKRIYELQQRGFPARLAAIVAWDVPVVSQNLISAIADVCECHEALQTILAVPEGRSRPVQKIREQGCHFRFTTVDVAETDEKLMQQAMTTAEPQPVFLWNPGETKSRLAMSFPCELMDHAALKAFVRDLGEALAARNEGKVWQQEVVQFSQYSAWLESLEEEQQSTSMPWPNVATAQETSDLSDFQAARFELPAIPFNTFENLSDSAPEKIIGLAWLLTLGQLNQTRPLPMLWSAPGRSYEELADVVGPFLRYLPSSSQLKRQDAFADLLRDWSSQRDKGLDWQDFFGLSDHHHANHNPYGFLWHSASGAVENPINQPEVLDTWDLREPCDLLLEAGDDPKKPWQIHFNENCYTSSQVAVIAKRLRHLVAQLDQATVPSGRLSWVLPEEATLLAQVNRVETAPNSSPSLLTRFETWAAQAPTHLALVSGEKRFTYGELNQAANCLAQDLLQRGLRPEQPVLLRFDREAHMVISMLAVLKAGGVFVPLDLSDQSKRAEAIAQVCQPAFWLTNSWVSEFAGAPERLNVDAFDFDAHAHSNPNLDQTAAQLAYIIFTSGSTGRPKGVAVSHGAIASYLDGVRLRLNLEDQWSYGLVSTMAADLGQTSTFTALASGGTLHLLPQDTVLNGESFAEYLSHHQVDCLKITPSHLSQLLATDKTTLPNKRLILGGEAASPELLERLRGTLQPGAELYNHYGPTETTIGVLAHGDSKGASHMPLGKPMAGTYCRILNADAQMVPPGTHGELFIGGGNLARGYVSNPRATAQTFLPDPFGSEPGARVYRTGDRVVLREDGLLHYLGRVDFQLKIRGYRVEPGEIEQVFHQFEGLDTCLIRPWQQHQLVLYYTHSGQAPRETELREFGKRHLPEYMVPNLFVPLAQFPLNANGKVDMDALPQPKQVQQTARRPQTRSERALAEIWQTLFSLEEMDAQASFFDLGGNSLLAIRLIGMVSQQFGTRLNIERINAHPTLEALAAYLDEAAQAPEAKDPVVAPLQTQATGQPWFCVHPSGGEVHMFQPLAEALSEVHPFYGLRSPAIENPERMAEDLPALAKDYVEAVRRVQPEGPYLIAGYSLGGSLAYEMAQQLTEAGEEVTSLVLIDAWRMDKHQALPKEDALFWDFLNEILPEGAVENLDIASICGQAAPETWPHHLAEAFAELGLTHLDATYLDNHFRVYRQHRQMVLGFEPKPYDGEVILIRASASVQSGVSNQGALAEVGSYGWRECGLKNFKVYDVPGDHQSIWNAATIHHLKPAFDRTHIKEFMMKRVHHEVMVSLTQSTGNFYLDRLLTGMISLLVTEFGDGLRAVFVAGSHADQYAIHSSDVDIKVIFKEKLTDAQQYRAESLLRQIRHMAAVSLDCMITDQSEVFRWALLINNMTQVFGSALTFSEDAASELRRFRVTTHLQAFFSTRVRGMPAYSTFPLELPNAKSPYGGYVFEETDMMTGETFLSTRELANVVLKSAMALVAMRTGQAFYEKRALIQQYEFAIGDQWLDLIKAVYHLVREKWAYREPNSEAERAELTAICQKALAFENHFLSVYREFLLKEISENKPDGLWLSEREINEIFGIPLNRIHREIGAGRYQTETRSEETLIRVPHAFRHLAVLMLGQFVFPDSETGAALEGINASEEPFLKPLVNRALFLWRRFSQEVSPALLVQGGVHDR